MNDKKKLHDYAIKNENLNLIGDCVEAVYKTIDKSKTYLPIENLKSILSNKTNPSEFEIVKTIAKGGYGEVFLVQKDKIYAMKRVSKETVLKQPNTALFMAEKSLLIDSINSEWLVSAEMTLQDDDYLYYLMDFIPGGDFMGLLSKEDVLEEEWVRFYVIELVAALDELHKLGWIHRDLKPDNILIGKDGHIKLADFGSSIKMTNGKAKSIYVVGTPDYISPDILESGNAENEYSEDVDFWTLGVIIYEMLFGATPFYSFTLIETYEKITNVSFTFPFKISEEMKDLISKLICKKEHRLNINEIKSHPYFQNVDWKNVKKMEPPFIPEMCHELDTSNFIDTQFEIENRKTNKINYIDFIGFSYDPKLRDTISAVIMNDDNEMNSKSMVANSNDNEMRSNSTVIKSTEMNNSTLITNSNEKKSNNLIMNNNTLTNNKIFTNNMEVINKETEEIEIFTKTLEVKKEQLRSVEQQIINARKLLNDQNLEYKNLINKILQEKEEADFIENKLNTKKDEMKRLDTELKTKKIEIEEVLRSLKIHDTDKSIKIDFQEKIYDFNKIIRTVYELKLNYKTCKQAFSDLESNFSDIKGVIKKLQDNIVVLEKENDKLKKSGVDSLKKQLRILTTEVKEYQQKCNQEMCMRKHLEEELKNLKASKSSPIQAKQNHEFICSLILDKQKLLSTIKILDDTFYINDKYCLIGNVYIQELKNNELYHESYKNRSLIIKIIFIRDSIKSVSSAGRRSLVSLEEDYQIEQSMKSGLENMMPLLQGKQLEEAKLQYEGTMKKITQLNREMEAVRKGTLQQSELEDDPVKLYEFNNHLFASKTFSPGTLCEHCNEVLYGKIEQGFECKDCKMIVHKSCYVLGDVSCETFSAFKKGESFYILMRSREEKEKLINVYKRF